MNPEACPGSFCNDQHQGEVTRVLLNILVRTRRTTMSVSQRPSENGLVSNITHAPGSEVLHQVINPLCAHCPLRPENLSNN